MVGGGGVTGDALGGAAASTSHSKRGALCVYSMRPPSPEWASPSPLGWTSSRSAGIGFARSWRSCASSPSAVPPTSTMLLVGASWARPGATPQTSQGGGGESSPQGGTSDPWVAPFSWPEGGVFFPQTSPQKSTSQSPQGVPEGGVGDSGAALSDTTPNVRDGGSGSSGADPPPGGDASGGGAPTDLVLLPMGPHSPSHHAAEASPGGGGAASSPTGGGGGGGGGVAATPTPAPPPAAAPVADGDVVAEAMALHCLTYHPRLGHHILLCDPESFRHGDNGKSAACTSENRGTVVCGEVFDMRDDLHTRGKLGQQQHHHHHHHHQLQPAAPGGGDATREKADEASSPPPSPSPLPPAPGSLPQAPLGDGGSGSTTTTLAINFLYIEPSGRREVQDHRAAGGRGVDGPAAHVRLVPHWGTVHCWRRRCGSFLL